MPNEVIDAIPKTITVRTVYPSGYVEVDDIPLDLAGSLLVRKLSPNGFSWGYEGRGAAQFALALLLRFLPREAALRYYRQLKDSWVRVLPEGSFYRSVPFRQIMERVVSGSGFPGVDQRGEPNEPYMW